MPRPLIDPDLLAEWEQKAAQILASAPARAAAAVQALNPNLPWGDQREAILSAFWLEHVLKRSNCPTELCRDLCFAHGQRGALSKDPWADALQSLADYRAGKIEMPGRELAAKLYRQRVEGKP